MCDPTVMAITIPRSAIVGYKLQWNASPNFTSLGPGLGIYVLNVGMSLSTILLIRLKPHKSPVTRLWASLK